MCIRDSNLTNLKKVFWPDDGITKGDLIDLALLVIACAADLYRFACHRT